MIGVDAVAEFEGAGAFEESVCCAVGGWLRRAGTKIKIASTGNITAGRRILSRIRF